MPKNRTHLLIATCIVLIQPIILLIFDPWTILFISSLLNNNDIDKNWTLTCVIYIVTCGQTTLISTWVALSPIRSYIKFPIAIFGLAWLWRVQTRGGFGFAAGQAMQIAIQASVIVLFILLLRLSSWIFRRRKDSMDSSQPIQYSIAFLLIWTTVFALLMGLEKIAIARNGWTINLFQRDYFGAIFYGPWNAISGLLMLGIVIIPKRRFLKIVVVLLILAFLIGAKTIVDPCLSAHGYGPMTYDDLIFQAIFLFATLLPLRWCGFLGANGTHSFRRDDSQLSEG